MCSFDFLNHSLYFHIAVFHNFIQHFHSNAREKLGQTFQSTSVSDDSSRYAFSRREITRD